MKNKKLLIILPILFIVCAIGVTFIKESYSLTENEGQTTTTVEEQDSKKYKYIRRNMLSHHFITSNSDPSGTMILKSGSVTSVSGTQKIVYCAHKGKWIAKPSQGRYYKRVPIAKTKVSALKKAQARLTGVITNSYPYIKMSELRARLKSSLGEEEYNEYNFDTLDVQEAMTATQAAIWNAIAGKVSNKYRTTAKIGSIKYKWFHLPGDKVRPINWDKTSAYKITGNCYKGTGTNHDCEAKSTFYYDEDFENGNNPGVYKTKKQDPTLGKRINRLINWYFTLKDDSLTSASKLPDFGVKPGSEKWTNEGKTLEITVIPNDDNFLYTDANKYEIEFVDANGKTLTASGVKVEENGKTTGYTYTINNIETNSIKATVKAIVPSGKLSVYVYQANTSYSNSQYLIGADSDDVEIEDTFTINNDKKGKLYLYKKNLTNVSSNFTVDPVITKEKAGNVCTEQSPCVEGALFAIYTADKETVYQEIESQSTPIEIELPVGQYYIQEVSSPVGYTVNNNLYSLKIEEKDEVVSVRYNNVPTLLCVKKVSSVDKEPIEDGATFQVLTALGHGAGKDMADESEDGADDDQELYEEFTIYSQVNGGVHCVSEAQLPVGYYYIEETKFPKGYRKNNIKYRVKVGNPDDTDVNEGEDGETSYSDELSEEIVFEDGSTVVDLPLQTLDTQLGKLLVAVIENRPSNSLTKSDFSTGECVPGAHLVVKDDKGNKVDDWTSSCEEGKDSHELELAPGKYTVTEEIAPSGYATAETIEFTVKEDGSVDTSLDMKDKMLEACIQKVSGNTTGIAGAEFEMYDSNGKLYKKFTTTKNPTCFQYIPVGKYTIKETKAPNGYKALDKPIEITIKDTPVTQNFTINNEALVEKTSMDREQLVVIIASVFMICGLGLVLYYGYQKQA